MLQKYLVARGTSVITAGGGMFQSTARSLYNSYHPSGHRCVEIINGC